MKPIRLISFAVLALSMAFSAVSCGKKATSLEVSFNYTKQQGPGSNQYAVWIENENNEVVKTLFVTHFSALGRARNGETPDRGYHYRPSCVHRWVQNVKADSLSDAQLDAFTGATPAQGGVQSFVWDFTDQNGQKVAPGNYTVWVEADLHDWTIKTFSCPVTVGAKPGVLEFSETYDKPDANYENMITDVKFELK